jgi:hypothetical protein
VYSYWKVELMMSCSNAIFHRKLTKKLRMIH